MDGALLSVLNGLDEFVRQMRWCWVVIGQDLGGFVREVLGW